MKKNILVIMLCIVFVASMALGACRGGTAAPEPAAPAPAPAEDSGNGGDAGGSAGGSGVEGKTVGIIPLTLANGFHQAEQMWRIKFAEEKGLEVIYLDGEVDQPTIVRNLDQLIAAGVDGIVLHSLEIESVIAGIDEARANDIAIITYYVQTPNNIPFVAINESTAAFQMGVVAAEQWTKAHPDIPIVYSLVNLLDMPVVQEMRANPWMEGILSVAPDAKLGLNIDGGGTREGGYKAAQDILQAVPETNLIYGCSSDYSLAIWPVLQEAGRGKFIDGVPQTEILVGTDAVAEEMKLLFDPTSSFKVTMGLTPKDNARVIIDTIVGAMLGTIDPDKRQTIDTYDKQFDYWNTTVEDARAWFKDQYGQEPEF